MSSKLRIQFEVPTFLVNCEPRGRLPNIPVAHALWYYNMLATQAWLQEQDVIVYEGEPDHLGHYAQLFMNCAMMYGVDIEQMANLWPAVDAEIDRLNVLRILEGQVTFKKLPEKFRMRSAAAVQTLRARDASLRKGKN